MPSIPLARCRVPSIDAPHGVGIVAAVFFLLTCLPGLWAAFDKPTAYKRFTLMGTGLALAVGLGFLTSTKIQMTFGIISTVSILLGSCLGISFMFLTGISSGPVANGLAILFPLSLVNVIGVHGRPRWREAVPKWAGVTVILIALILTRERTAWLALCAGTLFAGIVYGWPPFSSGRWARWGRKMVLMSSVFFLVVYLVILSQPSRNKYWKALPLGPLAKRLPLWRDSLDLIQDYAFSGIGQGSTAMAFSSYVYLLHVPFQNQAHNLYLEIALEQGVPGLIAFLGMVISAGWALGRAIQRACYANSMIAVRCLASLMAMLVYGMFDSEGYASSLIPLIFLPLGCAWLSDNELTTSFYLTPISTRTKSLLRGCVVVLFVSLCLLISDRHVRAQFMANIGALSQMRTELSVYRWPAWKIQDEVRRDPAIDLTHVLISYKSALAEDTDNVTANSRLGQIELSDGHYGAAKRHLETAYGREPERRATRQLLGELYAISGNSLQALELWDGLDLNHGQLDARCWFYQSIGAMKECAALKATIEMMRQRG